ncbi:TolC family protein [Spirosoma sp. HMF3257]|nr:TolC family protein [Spirosoma telluris]
MKKTAIALLWTVTSYAAFAQDEAKTLTLDEALTVSQMANKSIQMAELDRSKSQADYRQTNAMFLPQVGISYTAMATNNPLNAFGFKLQQQSITQNDFNPDLLNKPYSTGNFYTKASIQQPLVNVDAYYMRKSAGIQTKVYDQMAVRTRQHVTFEVTKAYLQLQLAYRLVSVQEKALATANALLRFTSHRFTQGLVQKSDVLNMQVYVNTMESQLADAKSNIQNASDFLSLLMNKPTGTIYQVPEAANSVTATEFTGTISPNRADFKALATSIEAAETKTLAGKYSRLPRLNAVGDVYLNDKRVAGFGSGSYLLGLQLSWDVFNGNKTKFALKSQAFANSKMKVQLDDIMAQNQLAYTKAMRDLENTKFKRHQQESAISQAEEVLRLTENRYRQGLETTTQLLTAQTQLAQQKLVYEQVTYDQNNLLAYLQFLTAPSN